MTIPDYRWGREGSLLSRVGSRFASTRPGSWTIRKLMPLDRKLLMRTRGRRTLLGPDRRADAGARDDRPEVRPAAAQPAAVRADDGDSVIVVGSNFGQQHHPAWTGNLMAHPRAQVVAGGVEVPVVAELLTRRRGGGGLAEDGRGHPGLCDLQDPHRPRDPGVPADAAVDGTGRPSLVAASARVQVAAIIAACVRCATPRRASSAVTWFLTVFSARKSRCGDLAVGQPLGDEEEDLPLLRREVGDHLDRPLVERDVLDHAGRHRPVDHRVTAGDQPDAVDERAGGDLLEHVAGGAGQHRGRDRVVVAPTGEDQAPDAGVLPRASPGRGRGRCRRAAGHRGRRRPDGARGSRAGRPRRVRTGRRPRCRSRLRAGWTARCARCRTAQRGTRGSVPCQPRHSLCRLRGSHRGRTPTYPPSVCHVLAVSAVPERSELTRRARGSEDGAAQTRYGSGDAAALAREDHRRAVQEPLRRRRDP